ncbi:Hypothetical predicted protein [Octopus vulgaris]|uniref:Uncharacterized protein n=1 Tax=Octopus vulgaris TaxID=6645 RepID=A0AA36AXU6_OCTVU|nr:Hypothetical predicted protein [Octopus vulgaris]
MMPRDRLLALLRNLHFNSGENQDDRLHKIRPIVDEVAESGVCPHTGYLYGREFEEIQGKASIETRPNLPALESRFIEYASQLAKPMGTLELQNLH